MIKLSNLTKIYNSGESVGIGIHDVNLEFNIGEFVAIIGSSGSGKTTLLNIVTGMDTYTEGEMFINGVSTANFDTEDLENYRRSNVAFIFQNYQLIDSYTVLENVMVELIIRGINKKDAIKKAKELLEKVGMGKRLHHRATKLSGGEKQRVVIARALASDAKILACDEPTGNLDDKNSKEIMELIKGVSKDKLVLFVTHDETLIKDNATRLIKIRDGKIESDIVLSQSNTELPKLNEPKKNTLKTNLYIASKNLVRTPKKSLFVSLVFLLLSFVIMFSIAYIPLNMIATSDTVIEFNMFENRDENRIIAYKNDPTYNYENIENAYFFENDFVLDYHFRGSSTSPILNKYISNSGDLKLTKNNLILTAGRFPNEGTNNEVLVVINDNLTQDFYDDVLENNTKIKFAFDAKSSSYFSSYYTIVGIAKTPEADFSHTSYYLTPEGATLFIESYVNALERTRDASNFVNDFCLILNDKKYPIYINDKLEDNQINIDFKFKDEPFELLLGNIKVDINNYDLSYIYNTINSREIQMNFSTALKIVKNNNYRVSYYAETENIDDVISNLKANTNVDIFPLKEAKQIIPEYDFISILKNLFYFFFIFIEIIASLFITVLITSFILGTKKKELGVLRVIGLNQKDVLTVLNFEVTTIMIISILTNIIAAIIFKLTNSTFAYGIIFDNPLKLTFSIVLLVIMAIFISHRWNKKMFKQTAREVLKAGE